MAVVVGRCSRSPATADATTSGISGCCAAAAFASRAAALFHAARRPPVPATVASRATKPAAGGDATGEAENQKRS